MKSALWTGVLFVSALCASVFTAGCGAGPGDGSSASLHGTISVSLTDAASDKVESFRVTVTAVDVRKSNSTLVHALAGPVTVDLADLTETGQLLNSATATIGNYMGVTITLDMSTAECLLAGKSTPATITNDQGTAFAAPLVVPLNIPPYLPLAAAAHKLIEVDLDLAQSLSIDTTANTVEFAPAFVVRIVEAQQKPVWLAGSLASVDAPNSSFVVDLHDENQVLVCSVTCVSDGATVFQTDGQPATGGGGLTALSGMALGTWVQAQGTPDPASNSVLVTNVNAGLGTWNGGSDIIEGHIVDRVGASGADATLTVLGRSSNAAHDTFQFNTSFDVTVTIAGTSVVRHGSATAYDTDQLNIGQRVRIFGTLTGVAMDASAGVVRTQPTWICGTANGAPAGGQLELTLLSVGLRDPSLYNFVAPAAFVTDVGTLADSLSIVNGTHVIERGFCAPVGGATDFAADAVVNADTAPPLLLVRNRVATGASMTLTPTAGRLDITVTGAPATGEFAVLDRPFVSITNLPTSPTPGIVPAASVGLYTLRDASDGTLVIFTHFPSFAGAVNAAVTGGNEMRHVAAIGTWNPITSTLTSPLVSVLVQ